MAKKKQLSNTKNDYLQNSTSLETSSVLPTDPLPEVKVNPVNLGEIKVALDDAVKKHLSTSYTPSHLYPIIHLTLGYLSVFLALLASYHGWRTEFEASKPLLWACVGSYFSLQLTMWGFKRYVEKGVIFNGQYHDQSKLESIRVISGTSLDPPSPPTVSSSSTHLPKSVPAIGDGPSYVLHLELKSGMKNIVVDGGKYVGGLVDTEGGVEEGELGRWVDELITVGKMERKRE